MYVQFPRWDPQKGVLLDLCRVHRFDLMEVDVCCLPFRNIIQGRYLMGTNPPSCKSNFYTCLSPLQGVVDGTIPTFSVPCRLRFRSQSVLVP